MNIQKEHLEEFWRLDQERYEKQSKRLDKMFKLLCWKKRAKQRKFFLLDSVINSISEFKYSPEDEVTFTVYFRSYEKVFQKDCATWSDEMKIRLLLGNFGQSEHE